VRGPSARSFWPAPPPPLPSGRDPEPRVRRVGCDHMTYFSADAGVAALRAALDA
jgi:hypothetical protein